MHPVQEIGGKPVVSADTGNKLGRVSGDLIDNASIDNVRDQLVGLVIGGGMLGQEHVLASADGQAIGGDTEVARGDSGIAGGRESRGHDRGSARSSGWKGCLAVNTGGRKAGVIGGSQIDEAPAARDHGRR